ncbi:pyruvate flavodoxin/ferredoxin oxidoreductase [uncultured Desulfobacter sp.]|uniref:pyruvate flavodoxin/ferredoxin oxidoreductase n=1 Tax=uncultured Desulfobacter sp. TaxID=240139 RepID=UPI002AABDDC0|nr:pyruvate flavodoxin/ferredoxin oxidoreductase [uncultured Desulfobacter sp.]
MAFAFMEGNEAIARGAIAAGCNFFAGYPITPATTIFNNMLKMLPPQGGICMQGEDEIASMGYCIGASMAGKKALTATSGPGISLYSENISFAIGSEIPLVIVNVQRLGPSTGSATRGADGDIQFMRWGNTGGVPVIVLAPKDIKDCYTLTFTAFNYAERFRCPVFIAANKELGMTKETFDMDTLVLPEKVERTRFKGKNFLPFAAEPDKAPAFLPIGGSTLVRQTSSTHGPDGYITIDPEVIAAGQARLRNKILAFREELSLYEKNFLPGTDTLVISYGITSRAVDEAARVMAEKGRPVSTLSLKTIWPVPEQVLVKAALMFSRILVVEMNLGQYVNEIRRVLSGKQIDFYGQMNGALIAPATIMEAIENE